MPSSSLTRLACLPVAVALCASLVACSPKEDPEPAPAPEPATTSQESSPEESPSEDTTQSSATSTTQTSTKKRNRDDESIVDTVREEFAALAPDSLFDELDTCVETSLKGSYDCSGSEVGQFQFFDSESMARDTTDVLTGLSSSRVVEESDEKIVGWSMLGKTAVITVVDKREGKVLQQMVSSGVDDPLKRIYTLGLAEREGTDDEPAETETETDWADTPTSTKKTTERS